MALSSLQSVIGKMGFDDVELKPLVCENFPDFINLLGERGEVPVNYYQWKYLEQPSFGKPTGFIAYLEGKPVGCIGIINRIYRADEGQETFATWFADWFVQDSVRGMGVGEKLLKKVAEVSVYSFGIPGPLKAQNLAKRVGYRANEFGDFYFFLRPFRYARLKFGRDSYLKSVVRTLMFYLRLNPLSVIGRFGKKGVYMELTREEVKLALGSESVPTTGKFVMNKEFVHWFSAIPNLPNGEKIFWSFRMSDAKFFLGFNEIDNYGLVRATVLYCSCETLDKATVESLNRELKRQRIDYSVICLSGFEPAKIGVKYHRTNRAYFVSLNGRPLWSFALDRENLWYSQQRFK